MRIKRERKREKCGNLLVFSNSDRGFFFLVSTVRCSLIDFSRFWLQRCTFYAVLMKARKMEKGVLACSRGLGCCCCWRQPMAVQRGDLYVLIKMIYTFQPHILRGSVIRARPRGLGSSRGIYYDLFCCFYPSVLSAERWARSSVIKLTPLGVRRPQQTSCLTRFVSPFTVGLFTS